MEDDINPCRIVGITLNIVCDRISIDHGDSTLIADHGDERQELTQARLHFGIAEGKWLSFLNVIHDYHHILEPAVGANIDFLQEAMPISIR
jgi:hypothetical protein